MWIFSFLTGSLTPLSLENYNVAAPGEPIRMNIPVNEKNWCPLVVQDKLYMVYNYRDFQLLDCTNWSKPCTLVHGTYNSNPMELKGGSPYQKIPHTKYYFSIAYTNLKHPANEFNVYRPTIAVIKTPNINDPTTFKLIFTGSVLNFHNTAFLYPITSYLNIKDVPLCGVGRILTVPSIARFDQQEDITSLTVNMNDSYNLLVHLKGMNSYLESVIDFYERGLLQADENTAVASAIEYYLENKI